MKERPWQPAASFPDRTGRSVHVGDFIVYAHALGRSAGLQYGLVLEICSRPATPLWWHKSPMLNHRIKVIGMDDHWGHNEPKLNERHGYLLFPERIILANDIMPDHARSLLLGYQANEQEPRSLTT